MNATTEAISPHQARSLSSEDANALACVWAAEAFPGYQFESEDEQQEDWHVARFCLGAWDVLTMSSGCPERYKPVEIDQLEDLALYHALGRVTRYDSEWRETESEI